MIFKGPGVYKVRCSTGDYSNNFQNIVVQAAPTNSLFLKASRNVAKPDESVTITAYGCPNGTVTWKNGNQTATGTQITVTGPGVRMAKCTGDYSNNGDWALAQIRNDGNITPYLNASVYEACPNQPVTVTATGCPNGWWYQTRWIKPGQLDYWLANRNAPIWEVYNYGSSNETKNGPNLYSARCISPDGSWMGDFDEKSITVEAAFPADLRATNNGPTLMGATSVRLAVTDVPGATYAWSGPNGYVSGLRSPEILTPTENRTGVYTVTVNKGAGQPWACNATATTKLTVSGCDIRIKASDLTTSEESYVLQKDPTNAMQYLPLALKVENGDGTPIKDMTFAWTAPTGITLTNPNANFVLVQKSGNYSVRVASVGNSSIGCRTSIQIAQENSQELLWSKRWNTTFTNGIPVKVVPLKYNGSARRYISNAENEQITIDVNKYIGHSMMLLYTKNSISRKDIIHVIPADTYNNTHSSINPVDFTGSILQYDFTGTIFRGGWKYNNGVVIGRIADYSSATSVTDDCVKKTIILEEYGNSGAAGVQTSHEPNEYGTGSSLQQIIDDNQKGDKVIIGGKQYIYKGVGQTPCCVNCVPLGTTQGNDPPSTNGESPANNEIIKGGPTSQPTTQFGELVCVQVAQLLACAEKNTPQSIINRNPNDSPDTQAAKFEESKKRFTLYVKLIEQALKDHPVLKPYASQINFPTNQATLDILAGSYGNAINDQQSYESVGCALTSGFGTATLPPAQKEILEDDLGKVCNQINEAYKALVPLIEDCNNANGVVNDILNTLQIQGKNPVKVFEIGKYVEEADITVLWNGLKGTQTPVSTNNPDNPAEVMLLRSDGVKMRYSPTNGDIFSYLKFTKDECENKITKIARTEKFKEEIKRNPFFLLEDCPPYEDWLQLGKLSFPSSVRGKIDGLANKMLDNIKNRYPNLVEVNSIWKILDYKDAWGANINLDYFPVKISKLPNGFSTPEQFLEHIRKNINNFVNTDVSNFHASSGFNINEELLWNSSNPLGAIIHIDIPIPKTGGKLSDDGDVICSDYSSNHWIFTTIQSPQSYQHPVSGNRQFGFDRNTDGSYTFYTRGLDRITDLGGTALEWLVNKAGISTFELAEPLWTSFQNKIKNFTNLNGGISTVILPTINRPDFDSVRDYLSGKTNVKPKCK